MDQAAKIKRDSVLFYRSFLDAIELVHDEKAKLQIYESIVKYGLNGVEPQSKNDTVNVIFTLIRAQIDANNRKFVNGKKGGAPEKNRNNPGGRGGKKPTNNQPETNHNQSEPTRNQRNANENDNVNENDHYHSKETSLNVSLDDEKPKTIGDVLAELNKGAM
ncbi:MAG: DUF6291 domain-containing protein [Candidatus Cloacimonetes bacterium]|nr:DUF6291 domain-containing protein [Candidatus Cloacimonadota bacterium]